MLRGRHGRKQCEEKEPQPFTLPAFKACFVSDVHLLISQGETWLSELSDTAFPLSTPIFLILTSTSCLYHGKNRPVTRAQLVSTTFLASGKQAAGRIASSTQKKHRKKGNSVIEKTDNNSFQASVKQRPRVNMSAWVCSEVNLWKACTVSVFHVLEMFKTTIREPSPGSPGGGRHAQTHPPAHKPVVPWLGRSRLECRHGETLACLKWKRLRYQMLLWRKIR